MTAGTWPDIKLLGRFGAVGLIATVSYFAITAGLGHSAIGFDPVVAHVLGTSASLLVSYAGHHRFTFRADGAHAFYLPRFLLVTGILFLLSTAAMAFGRYGLGLDHTLVTAGIAVGYPIMSYLLNALWTFARAGQRA
jgi:putative flippase GtrA